MIQTILLIILFIAYVYLGYRLYQIDDALNHRNHLFSWYQKLGRILVAPVFVVFVVVFGVIIDKPYHLIFGHKWGQKREIYEENDGWKGKGYVRYCELCEEEEKRFHQLTVKL